MVCVVIFPSFSNKLEIKLLKIEEEIENLSQFFLDEIKNEIE